MVCASCRKGVSFETVTLLFCRECGVLLCRRCVRHGKQGTHCPNCNGRISRPLVPIMTLLLVATLPFLVSLMVLSIQEIETGVSWDRMDVTPFEEAADGDVVKICGRILADREIVLESYQGDDSRRDWNVTDFILIYQDHRIHVNMSDFDKIYHTKEEPNTSHKYFKDHDLVYIVGTIYQENDSQAIHADIVIDDHQHFSDKISSYYISALVISVGLLLVCAVLCELTLLYWLMNRDSIRKGSFPTMDHPHHELPSSSGLAGKNERVARMERMVTLATGLGLVLLVVLVVVGITILLMVVGVGGVNYEIRALAHGTIKLSLLSRVNSIVLATIILLYPRLPVFVHVSGEGLYYRFGFGELEFLEWAAIRKVDERSFSLLFETRDEEFVSLPLHGRKQRDEIVAMARAGGGGVVEEAG